MKNLPITIRSLNKKTIFIGLSFLCFAIPFSLGHPQILVGSLVNAGLILSALLLPTRLFLPIVVFPSLSVLSRGLIFGPLTPFLFILIPFIWLGNLSLVLIFKKIFSRSNYFLALISSALCKSSFLFISAKILVLIKVLPKPFLQSMGIIQLQTAFLGGLLAFLFFKGGLGGKF